MKIIRGRLSAAEVSNPTIRYNPDTDQLEFTPDGGVTWNPAPGSDPRHSTSFLRPPVAGSSKACDSAANMTKWLKDFIDQCLFDFELVGTVTTIINSILLSLNVLSVGFASLLEIISELAETISGIGGAALAIAFTSTEYDLLNCIFFCNADTSGRISADKLATVETQVTAQLNTTAALVVNGILFLQGEIGLSNAGAIGSETGDCTSCACEHCFVLDFADGDGSALGFTLQGGVYTDGCCVQGTSPLPDFANVYGYWTFPSTIHVVSFEMEYSKPGGSGADNVNWVNMLNPVTDWVTTTILRDETNIVDPTGGHLVKHTDVDLDCAGMGFDINMGGFLSSPSSVYKLRVYYTGDEAFGGDNC